MRALLLLLAIASSFVIGMVGYPLIATWPPVVHLSGNLISLWQTGFAVVGITLWGLLALALYLVLLTLRVSARWLSGQTVTPETSAALRFIAEAGPIVGVLGTMLALAQAMSQVDMGSGLQLAVRELTARMGQALNSSIGGIGLALAAYLLRHMVEADVPAVTTPDQELEKELPDASAHRAA